MMKLYASRPQAPLPLCSVTSPAQLYLYRYPFTTEGTGYDNFDGGVIILEWKGDENLIPEGYENLRTVYEKNPVFQSRYY